MLHTGALGSAIILKVITNYMATENIVSCIEALSVAKASGINLNVAYEAMKILLEHRSLMKLKVKLFLTEVVIFRSPWILLRKI